MKNPGQRLFDVAVQKSGNRERFDIVSEIAKLFQNFLRKYLNISYEEGIFCRNFCDEAMILLLVEIYLSLMRMMMMMTMMMSMMMMTLISTSSVRHHQVLTQCGTSLMIHLGA